MHLNPETTLDLVEDTLERRTPVREIIARIVFDSVAQPSIPGLRHAPKDQQVLVRQVVSEAEEFDIHVRIYAVHNRRDLLGQILPRDTGAFIKNARLHLRQNDKRIRSAELNDFGEFQFTGIPDGWLSLQIDLPHLTVISALYDGPEAS